MSKAKGHESSHNDFWFAGKLERVVEVRVEAKGHESSYDDCRVGETLEGVEEARAEAKGYESSHEEFRERTFEVKVDRCQLR